MLHHLQIGDILFLVFRRSSWTWFVKVVKIRHFKTKSIWRRIYKTGSSIVQKQCLMWLGPLEWFSPFFWSRNVYGPAANNAAENYRNFRFISNIISSKNFIHERVLYIYTWKKFHWISLYFASWVESKPFRRPMGFTTLTAITWLWIIAIFL